MPTGGKWRDRFRVFASVALITLCAGVLSVLAITPKLVPWRDHPLVFETTKVASMIEQLHDPAGWDRQHLQDPEFDGIQSIRWRILPPVAGRALGLSPHAYLTTPWLGLLLLLGLCVHYSRQRGANTVGALAVGILVGTSSAFFSASCAVGYFDPFYLIALVVATFTPSRILFLAACLLGPWVDEKFLLMLPACGAIRWTWQPDRSWIRSAVLGIVPYCLVRLGALYLGDSSVQRQLHLQGTMFFDYAPALPEGWWYGFRLGWVLIVAGMWDVGRKLPVAGRWWLVASLVGAIGSISFLAWDTTRSIAFVLPFLLAGLGPTWVRKSLPWLAGVNLLLPAAYVWCGQPVTVPLKSILFR